MPTINPAKRGPMGIPAQSSSLSSTSNSSHAAVGSTTVLVPLVLSITLIALGIGLGVFCFVGYRRRQRIWWRDFERRRVSRERGDVMEKGPGMWEVEVRQEVRDVDMDWNERPVAVTYRREHYPSSPSFQNLSSSTSSTLATSLASMTGYMDNSEPNQVEMTFLIAMPSPISTPTRSRRTSPSSSLPDLYEASKAQSDFEVNWKGDEIPEVELATVVMPLERYRIR